MYCIYVFSDEYGVPKYVGKAKILKNRIRGHYKNRFKYDTYFYRWLNKQISYDKEFFIDVLEEVTQENWVEREKYWIVHIKENNFPLTNMTDGGDGNNNQIFTEESKRKRSERMKGRTVSEEIRTKISNAHKGKILSEDTKLKLSVINKGKRCLESTKLKFSIPVNQHTLDGEFIQQFESLTKAAEFIGCRKSTLSNVINRNKNKKFKNFIWSYQII